VLPVRQGARSRRVELHGGAAWCESARLYRLALESAPAGTRLHAVGDEGIAFRRIAQAIGHGLDVPVRSVQQDQASDYVGYLAPFVTLDNPTTAARTRELLGWEPTQPGLLDDLDQGHYFEGKVA
jgi:nucleoside-diphosphate-sugar epimerase